MIKGMGADLKGLLMKTLTKASMWKAKLMARACLVGSMEKFTMVNGSEESKKAMVFGKAPKAIHTLANGSIPKQRAMVCINGKMEISMKESGKPVSDMGMDPISFLMAIIMSASIGTATLVDLVSIIG